MMIRKISRSQQARTQGVLVVNSNFGRISYRFRDIDAWHKARKHHVFPSPLLFEFGPTGISVDPENPS